MKSRDTASFFARLAETRSRALLVNVDVILKLFASQSSTVALDLRGHLPKLMKEANTRVILTTRGSAKELKSKMNMQGLVEIWGNYGLERLLPDGTYKVSSIDIRKSRALKAAQYVASDANLAHCLRANIGMVALQWQNLSTPAIHHARNLAFQAWRPIAETNNLLLRECVGGLELRLRECDTSCAITAMLAEPDPPGMIVYISDDCVDENAFRVLRPQDLAVLLCTEQRNTIANLWINSCEDLAHFFNTWVESCSSSQVD